MKLRSMMVGGCCLLAGVALTWTTMSFANAEEGQPEFPLPPGWTEADIEACMLAGTPGEEHKKLTEDVGKWEGTMTMWMFPGADPVQSPTRSEAKMVMGGRYLQVKWFGDAPGMGPYEGMGLYGYDNVTQQWVATSIDSMGTGIAHATGTMSNSGKTITWKYTYNCPVTKKPTIMREVGTVTGEDTRKMEMYTVEPKSGKEYKMLVIEMKRQ